MFLKMLNGKYQVIAIGTVAFLLFVLADSAYANAASHFSMYTGFHLFVGNSIIGIIEGLLIAKVFKVRKSHAVLLMIAANYFSSWIGSLGLIWLSSRFEVSLSHLVTIHNIHSFVWLLFFAAWFVTVILEYPFCLFMFWKKDKRLRQAVSASLLAQTLSYILLIIFISPFGHFEGYPHKRRTVSFAPVETFADANNVTIYFIGAFDGDLYSIKPDGSSKEKVTSLNMMDREIRLIAKNDPNSASYRLYAQERPPWKRQSSTPLLDTGINVSGFTRSLRALDPNAAFNMTHNPALDLRPTGQQDFQVFTGYLGVSWLEVEKKDKQNKYPHRLVRLQFDDLILDWITCNATVLPRNQIVYQLGNQIVLLDINKRSLGLIAIGHGPVVFLNQ